MRSTYHPAFSRLVEEVEAARQEANDNVKYLKPLRKWAAVLVDLPSCLPACVRLLAWTRLSERARRAVGTMRPGR